MNTRNQSTTVTSQVTARQGKHRGVFQSIFVAVVCGGLTITGLGNTEAATVTNPSFEADTFTVFPGYVANNGPVTGWTGADGQGINPSAGSPFADNGTVPDGTQVGFLQGTASFGNTITGLTNGQQYELSFRVNARSGLAPTMSVDVGGTALVKSDVNPVGGANPYKYVVRTFTATGPTMPLNIHSTVLAGDRTLLVDDVRITAKPNAPWTVSPSSTVTAGSRFFRLFLD
jgi:hypothetical protein